MPPLRLDATRTRALRAVVLLQRYSLGLNEVADQALGDQGADNTDLHILLTVAGSRGEPVRGRGDAGAAAQHGVARAGAAAVEPGSSSGRTARPVDRRRAELHLTARGSARASSGSSGR